VKGLLILGLLVASIGGSLFFLLQESDADLRRIEDEIEAQLDECDRVFRETHRALSGLRAIQPTMLIMRLEGSLNQGRSSAEAQRAELGSLREIRPAAGAPRAAFIDSRKAARTRSESLLALARQLHARVVLIDEFSRTTEPRLRLMIENKGILFALRQQVDDGRDVEPALLVKIDQLAEEAESVRRTAAQVANAAAEDLGQAQVLSKTVSAEVERVIKEQGATIQRLNDMLGS